MDAPLFCFCSALFHFVFDAVTEAFCDMLIQFFDPRAFLFCGKVRIDLHRNAEIRMAEEFLRRLDVHVRVVQHGRIGMPKLMCRKRLHRLNSRDERSAVLRILFFSIIAHMIGDFRFLSIQNTISV